MPPGEIQRHFSWVLQEGTCNTYVIIVQFYILKSIYTYSAFTHRIGELEFEMGITNDV